MKIVHIVDFEHTQDNGIKGVVLTLQSEQEKLGSSAYIFNISPSNKDVTKNELLIGSLNDFKYNINALKPDIVIFHSVYKLPYIAFCHFLKKKKVPYLIEPHGGTSAENMKKSYFKKKIANILLFNSFFANAAGVVYLNKYELEKCVFKNIRKNALISPNGIYLPANNVSAADKPKDKINFTFLARIDIHHKGIDILLDAIAILAKKTDTNNFVFNFYGSSSNNKDIIYLKGRLSAISGSLFYHGSVVGKQKELAFTTTNIYVLTSRYEGMPLSILEALSYGCPCVITPQTNMQDIIEDNQCGWITPLNAEAIANTLLNAIKEYKQNQTTYTDNSIQSVLPFSWNSIAKKTLYEYSKILGKV